MMIIIIFDIELIFFYLNISKTLVNLEVYQTNGYRSKSS